jgi:hypothetical protein
VEVYTNRFLRDLTANYTAGDTSLHVSAAAPAAVQGGTFRVRLANVQNTLLKVTGGANTTTWTVVAEANDANCAAGSNVVLGPEVTAGMLDAIRNDDARRYLKSVDLPPSNPTQWDDEFDSTTLAAKWGTPGSVTDGEGVSGAGASYDVNTSIPSSVFAYLTVGAPSFAVSQSSAPSGAFRCTAKFICHPISNYQGAYVYFMEAGNANGVRMNVEFNGLANACYTAQCMFSKKDSGTWTFGYFSNTIANTGVFYVHLQYDGSNWRQWCSLNGYTWMPLGSSLFKPFTVASLSLSFKLNGSVVDTRFGCDWIRFNWLTLP